MQCREEELGEDVCACGFACEEDAGGSMGSEQGAEEGVQLGQLDWEGGREHRFEVTGLVFRGFTRIVEGSYSS